MRQVQPATGVGVHRDACGGVIVTVQWEGFDKLSEFLNETPGVTRKMVRGALFSAAEDMMSESKRRTPVDTGRLRSTGHVKPPEEKGGKVEVTMAYGTDYAIYVHERPASHPTGQMKYLESAVNEGANGLTDRLISDVLNRIGKT